MKVLAFKDEFNKLSIIDKEKYIKELLKDNSLKIVINSLIVNNNDVIENFQIIDSISKGKDFKPTYGITKLQLISLVINLYVKNNKTDNLEIYFNELPEPKLKKIFDYEKKNKTEFSKLKFFNNYDDNKKNNTKKVLEVDTVNKKNKKNILKKEIKSKKVKFSIFFTLFIIVMVILYILVGYSYYIIGFYNNHISPNTYLNNELISDLSFKELNDKLDEKELIIEENLVLKNDNDNYTYTYKSIGFYTNKDELKSKIIDEYKKLNGYQKLYKILFGGKINYDFIYSLNDDNYNIFIEDLKGKVNVSKTNEYISIKNGQINYQRGMNGFTLDDSTLKDEIKNSITTDIREISLHGNIEKVNNSLGVINKKVSTFTTYYNESQGRAKNIRNAVSKLNGKVLYPNDVFSFYKAVGPYNGAHGYIFYAKDVGSGVCQVSTTVYNAALLLNLPIIARENHGDMVPYVDYGMDATVYGSSVDMKFRNSSNYPIYIEASAYNGTLTVSFWSNENIIEAGYEYKPRVEALGGLGFKTYLDTYYNGNYVSTKYLNSSYYVKGK